VLVVVELKVRVVVANRVVVLRLVKVTVV